MGAVGGGGGRGRGQTVGSVCVCVSALTVETARRVFPTLLIELSASGPAAPPGASASSSGSGSGSAPRRLSSPGGASQ